MTTIPLRSATMSATRGYARWLRALLYGALWGVAASVLESVSLPFQGGSWSSFWSLVTWITPGWCVVGVGIALLVEAAGARFEHPAPLVAGVIGAALAFSALWTWLYSLARWPAEMPGIGMPLNRVPETVAAYLYQAWVVAFYGGLYAVAWSLNNKAERTRQMLANARLARLHTETMLGEAQLQALRGHVDPHFLLRVMTEVEHRYARTPDRADRLMGLFVALLRRAVAGVRSGQSTLADELRLVRAYAELWAELEPDRNTWTLALPEPLPLLPFPPLLLLPVLDRLAEASSPASRGSIRVACAGDAVEIRIDGGRPVPAGWLAADHAYRTRVGLSTLFGSAWSMALGEAPDGREAALTLAVRWPQAMVDASEWRAVLREPLSTSKGA